ncbi:MAG TPA: protein tyrosine phosphatase family protein [Anaerolineales bacterium]|nr:protein tyrosine phosphatase family protein [Anaerolineales bacterium]
MLETLPNFLKLDENLITSGQPSEAQLVEVAEAGYQTVINLALSDAEYSLKDEAASVRQLGMAYVHIPVIWTAPTLSDLEQFFESMDANQSKKIYVHCAANMRASVFIALYRIIRMGWRVEDATIDLLRIWTPDPMWQILLQDALAAYGKMRLHE